MLNPNAQQHFNARLRRSNVVPGQAPQAPAGTGGFNMQGMKPTGPQIEGRTPRPMGGFGNPGYDGPALGGGGSNGGIVPPHLADKWSGANSEPTPFRLPPQGGAMPPPRQVDFQPRPQGGEPTGFRLPPNVAYGEGPLQSPANPAGNPQYGQWNSDPNPPAMATGGFNMQGINQPMGGGDAEPQNMWQKLKRPMMQKQEWDGWNL